MKADYRVFAAPNSVELRELLDHARVFVSKAEEMLKDT
jgi:hypothetical protein